MFGTLAAALVARAASATEMRLKSERLEEMNRRLETALNEAETSRLRLDTVLSSIDAGVMILSPEGRVLRANRAARELLGVPEDVTLAWTAPAVLDSVPREGDAEVRLDDASGTTRTLAVSRRTLDPATRDEVVHVADVSRRTRRPRRTREVGPPLATLLASGLPAVRQTARIAVKTVSASSMFGHLQAADAEVVKTARGRT